MPGRTESFVRLDAMVVPCWSGRALERRAPGGGAAGTGRVGRPPPRPGGVRLRVTEAADGDHRDPRPDATMRPGPGQRSFLSRLVFTSPHTKETLSVMFPPKVPGVLQAFRSPYGRTLPDMEGLETGITGVEGTAGTDSKVSPTIPSPEQWFVPVEYEGKKSW
ncbi:hypothetical protein GCM10010339_71930 [Streptomyces alanosinicus]|uniref:Uncharacterized protein n=1 Tax=Streptomyces alanosinicus TaxID=68171 RepID=A0A918YQS0_9ACTN|nr:hypothetical protein GCM10010339_71930 [Streptomyces alanosinicus]